jgi:Surface-adhesin protein E
MKRLLFILSCTLLLGLTEAGGADWKYYGQTQTASYFFDIDSISRQENIVRVWMKVVYSEKGRLEEAAKLGGKYINLTDSKALVEIDCRNKWHHVAVLLVYSMEGEVILLSGKQRDQNFIIPESILESFCKGARQ